MAVQQDDVTRELRALQAQLAGPEVGLCATAEKRTRSRSSEGNQITGLSCSAKRRRPRRSSRQHARTATPRLRTSSASRPRSTSSGASLPAAAAASARWLTCAAAQGAERGAGSGMPGPPGHSLQPCSGQHGAAQQAAPSQQQVGCRSGFPYQGRTHRHHWCRTRKAGLVLAASWLQSGFRRYSASAGDIMSRASLSAPLHRPRRPPQRP